MKKMPRAGWWQVSALAAAVAAGCGGDDNPPLPAVVAAGSGGGNSAPPELGGASGAADAEVGGSDPDAGPSAAGQGGQPTDHLPIGQIGGAGLEPAAAGAPASIPPLCDPLATWGSPLALSELSSDGADERLLAMTHDELTLVFSRGDALWLADRATLDADFTAVPLVLPEGYTWERGLALGADGLSLLVVEASGLHFAEVTRAQRSGAFDAAAHTEPLAYANDARSVSGGTWSSPVLADDRASLYYVERGGGRSDVWRVEREPAGRVKLDPAALGADEDDAKLTLSVSADARVLFVFDPKLGSAVGIWSVTADAAFTLPVALPDLESAFSNADCSRIYGTRRVGGSLDIVIETPQ